MLKIELKRELDEMKNMVIFNRVQFLFNSKLEYPLVHQLLICIKLVFPSSVESESSFSLMNYVKSDTRTKMSDKTLDSILRIKFTREDDVNRYIKEVVENKN